MDSNLLQQAIDLANLRSAWEAVADNQGIPGVDDVSIRTWRRNWEERLVQLRREVRLSQYRPGRLRVRRIPKPDHREFRSLRIPTVKDRVLQRAVLQVLYPIFEPRFLDCSFGYRPGRGLKNAVERILVLRENGFRSVLDADIDDFFNRLDHAILLDFFKADLPDRSLDGLIGAWLKAGQPDPGVSQGIPMGSPLSPLFANVFLHRLDQAILAGGFHLVRYADDFVVFTASQEEACRSYQAIEQCLDILKLHYEPHKTRLTSFDEGFQFIGVWFEGDCYEYTWENRRISVHGTDVDWLFGQFGPHYE